VRLDKKILLIAPTIVLVFVVAGMIYATVQLRWMGDVGDTWKTRSDFAAAVERGEKPLNERQAINIIQHSLDVEAKQTEAIAAEKELMVVLSAIAAASLVALIIGVRAVPRR
jgi:hypothetical protein